MNPAQPLIDQLKDTIRDPDELRAAILELVGHYADQTMAAKPFEKGESQIPASGKLLGEPEMRNLVDSSLDGWLTTGRYNSQFEKSLGRFLDRKHVLTVNSGSSANLVALSSLCSPRLEDRALKPGDEVITVAAGFPTTVNPILLYGLIPVFVDVDIPTYNIDPDLIEAAISPKTRAIMVAHTLGNPFNLDVVMDIAKRHKLWVIEDCCDALGSTYRDQLVGTFGDIGTLSFYPAHHITMGEGGAVFTQSGRMKLIMESMRDWGRDCWCEPGCDNTCKKRYQWQLGDLPEGYDHKYTYSHLGYNLKITDMQAAVGLAQLDRLDGFIASRRHNFDRLKADLAGLQDYLILPEPTPNSQPSWFGFPITLQENLPFSRETLLQALNQANIGTRLLFSGNLVRQPYMQRYNYRIAGDLTQSDRVMTHTFWIGLFPALGDEHIDYVVDTFHKLLPNLKD